MFTRRFSKSFLILLLALLCAPFFSKAQNFNAKGPQNKIFGLGIVAGDPTGIIAKGYIAPRMAIQGIGSWSFVDDAFTAVGDLQYEIFDIQSDISNARIPFFIGAGVKTAFKSNNTIVTARFPVGVSYHFDTVPIEIEGAIAPGLNLTPSTEFDVSGGISAKYFF